jgi:hypothetical protein
MAPADTTEHDPSTSAWRKPDEDMITGHEAQVAGARMQALACQRVGFDVRHPNEDLVVAYFDDSPTAQRRGGGVYKGLDGGVHGTGPP